MARLQRARIYEASGKYEEALTDANRALALGDARQPLALTVRGSLYVDLNRYDDAVADFSKAIELDPTQGVVYVLRGVVYLLLNRPSEADRDFEAARAAGVPDTAIQAARERIRKSR
jgi:tetratricopeptide (TPR) repeat protein